MNFAFILKTAPELNLIDDAMDEFIHTNRRYQTHLAPNFVKGLPNIRQATSRQLESIAEASKHQQRQQHVAQKLQVHFHRCILLRDDEFGLRRMLFQNLSLPKVGGGQLPHCPPFPRPWGHIL